MNDDYRLLTPENVELRYQIAGLGSRLVAATIDYTLMAIGYLAVSIGTALAAEPLRQLGRLVVLPSSEVYPALGYAVLAVVVGLVFLGWWGYFTLFELVWNGQSPGKRLLGLRVVRVGGQPVNAGASLARNVLRAVDLFLLIGVLVMLLDRASRRLGDLAAGTLVVREPRALSRTALAPIEIPAVPPTVLEALPHAERLTAAHYTLVREYFARRRQLPPGRAERLAASLATDLGRVLEAPPGPDPEAFLAATAHAFEARHPAG